MVVSGQGEGSLILLLEHTTTRLKVKCHRLTVEQRKDKGISLLTRAHTGRWRFQENKTEVQVHYQATIFKR